MVTLDVMMEEKKSIDFKKFKKTSTRKLREGLGFFLSPREEVKGSISTSNDLHYSTIKKSNDWDNENLALELSSNEAEVQDKDYIDDIPIIPSLDDFADDDLTHEIANAPLVGVKEVTSYKDFDTDLLGHSAFTSLDEVNLQILIKLLHAESCLNEPDTLWTKDSLFNEIVTTFNERKC